MINDSGIEVRRSSGILVGTKFLKLGFDRFVGAGEQRRRGDGCRPVLGYQ
jgi:hypothetical protein